MRVLVVAWDSGGGVEVTETVVHRTVAADHDVRVLGTEGLRERMEAAGATFRPYRHAPDNDRRQPDTDLLRDWEAKSPLDSFTRIRDRVMFGPARLFCHDVVEELERETADVVLVDILVASALCGAEAAGVPRALLVHALYGIPRHGATPMGAGFRPSTGPGGRLRDRAVSGVTARLLQTGLPALNAARSELGLYPYETPLELFDMADRILVCTSPSYDFDAAAAPGNLVFVGPALDGGVPATAPGAGWEDPWAGGPELPLVLVGLSSTFMDQAPLLQQAADALGKLAVHGLVTTGPTVEVDAIVPPANVTVRQWVRHTEVLPHCTAVVTHGGHGTVMKALAAGVPLVVVPMGGDQPDNAARVVHAGAGVRVKGKPNADRLERAVRRVLDDPGHAAAARRMADRLAEERDDGLVVRELEAVAAGAPPTVHRRRGAAAGRSGGAPGDGSGRGGEDRVGERKVGAAADLEMPSDLDHQTIEVHDGAQLGTVVSRGTGPTIVLLHGSGLTSEMWVRQFEGLGGSHRLVACDLRGHGGSTTGEGGAGIDVLVADLFAVLERLDVRRGLLVGHSLGAFIVLEAAITHGDRLAERVDRLLLVSTTGGMFPAAASGPVKRVLVRAGAKAEKRWRISSRAPGATAVGVRLSFGADKPGDAERALVRRMISSRSTDPAPEMVELLTGYDARGRLDGVALPTVVVAGVRDNYLPVWHARHLTSSLPDAELVPFPRAGHMVMLENPDGFNALLARVAQPPA